MIGNRLSAISFKKSHPESNSNSKTLHTYLRDINEASKDLKSSVSRNSFIWSANSGHDFGNSTFTMQSTVLAICFQMTPC